MRMKMGWALWATITMPLAAYAELATILVQRSAVQAEYVAEGAVEAVRASVVAAQTTGRITALSVRAGDRVVAGQILARIDERIAADEMAASRAQLAAARNDYERSQQLFAKQYISKAAMDRAEAQYKTLSARTAGSATNKQLHTIVAPYAGVIASVEIEVGDMAVPGKPLFAVYAPDAMRVVVQVPESIANTLRTDQSVALDISSTVTDKHQLTAGAIELLPTRDAISHSAQVRLALPIGLKGVAPGQFARAHLPLAANDGNLLMIPLTAVMRRAEFDAVYVIDKQGKPQLRQVRLGRSYRALVEVLAGLDAGERIALDPLAAAKR